MHGSSELIYYCQKVCFFPDRTEWCSFHNIPNFSCSSFVKRAFYSAFDWKYTDICKHRFGVQLLQNPPLCCSTLWTPRVLPAHRTTTLSDEKNNTTSSYNSLPFSLVWPNCKTIYQLSRTFSPSFFSSTEPLIKNHRKCFFKIYPFAYPLLHVLSPYL